MSYKVAGISNPGTSIKFGADDMDLVSKLLNGTTTGIPAVTFKSTNKVGFWDNICFFRNQADSKSTRIRGQSNVPSTDVDLTLPPITGNDTLPAIGISQTWAAIQRYNAGVQFQEQSAPSNPSSGLHKVFVNAANGHLQKLNSAGALVDYDAAALVNVDLKDGILALRQWNYTFFKVGSTYYGVKNDGSILSSGSNPATVLQAILDVAQGVTVFITSAGDTDTNIDFVSGFAGLTVQAYTSIYCTGDLNFNCPSTFTGAVFKIIGPFTSIISAGAYINGQSSTKSANCFQIGTATSADDIFNCRIQGFIGYNCDTMIKINQASTGDISNNTFQDMTMELGKKAIVFVASGSASTDRNKFINIKAIREPGVTTDFAKDVAGTGCEFWGCQARSFTGAESEMSISANAIDTYIFGGDVTGSQGTFTDLGTNTYIDDGTHTEWKLKSGTITPSAITGDVNNWVPAGFNERVNTIRASSTGEFNVTGLVPPVNSKGRIVNVQNVGSNNMMFINESTSSTAANRFALSDDLMLRANQSVLMFYDSTSSRWRLMADAGAGHAMLNEPNDFTEYNLFLGPNAAIEIQKDNEALFFLSRDTNVVNSEWGTEYWAKDTVDWLEYGEFNCKIITNTNGVADGRFELYVRNAGVLTERFRFHTNGQLEIFAASTQGDLLFLRRESNVVNDTININLRALDSASNATTYGRIRAEIITNTDTLEDARMRFDVADAGTNPREVGRFNSNGEFEVFAKSTQSNVCKLRRASNTVGNQNALRFNLQDSATNDTVYAECRGEIGVNTDTLEEGKWSVYLNDVNSMVQKLLINTDGSCEHLVRSGNPEVLWLKRPRSTVGDNLQVNFQHFNASSAYKTYAIIRSEIIDNTASSEDGKLEFAIMENGSINEKLNILNDGNVDVLAGAVRITRDGNSTLLDLYRTDNTVANTIDLTFYQESSTNVKRAYSRLESEIDDNTNGSEDGHFTMRNMWNGTLQSHAKYYGYGDMELIHRANTTNDEWSITFMGLDSGSALQNYAKYYSKIITNTAGSEDGEFRMDLVRAGTNNLVWKLGQDGRMYIGRDGSNMRGVASFIQTNANDVVFNTSTAENTLFSTTVKGSVVGVDGHVIVKLGGYVLQNQATGTTYTFRIKVGGTTIWEEAVGGSLAQSATKRPWLMDLQFMPANESTTSARMRGQIIMNNTTAPTTGQGSAADDTVAAHGIIRAEAISWTFANDTTIAVTCQMSVSNAATEIMMDSQTLELAPT